MTKTRLLLLVLIGLSLYGTQANADEPRNAPHLVIVRTDGRWLQGQLDGRTDDRTLWLQSHGASISISHAVAWSDIDQGRFRHEWLSQDQLRREMRRHRPNQVISYFDLLAPSEKPNVEKPNIENSNAERPGDRVGPRRATHIGIYAAAANWDADTPRDGVKLSLTVRDDDEEPVSVGGQLRVTLMGRRRSKPTRRFRWEQIAAWTRTVRDSDFHNGSAVIRLKYPGRSPEVKQGYNSEAILHVVYQPKRQGVLKASQSMRLYPFEPMRDRLQVETGERFFRGER